MAHLMGAHGCEGLPETAARALPVVKCGVGYRAGPVTTDERAGDERVSPVPEAELRGHPIGLVPRPIPGDGGVGAQVEGHGEGVVGMFLHHDRD